MPTRVRDVMSSDVVTVGASATIVDAATLMRDRDIGDVLVTSNGSVKGIVTDRDIVVRALAEGLDLATTVDSMLTGEIHTIEADAPIARVVELMRDHKIRRVPVLNDAGTLVGIVSIGDLAAERDADSVLGQISAAPPNN
jgi:CBS domain-containing protein